MVIVMKTNPKQIASPSSPGFFRQHWKKLLVGLVIFIVLSMSWSVYTEMDFETQEDSYDGGNNWGFGGGAVRESKVGMPAPSMGSSAMMGESYDYAESYTEEAPVAPLEQRRISKNAGAQIEVSKGSIYGKFDSLQGFVSQNEGYLISSNEYKEVIQDKEYITIDIQFKVPFANFDQTLAFLRTLGEVKSLNSYASDVTNEYKDEKAYLESYKIEKERIQKLLEKAITVEDILKIESKLNELQRTIDQYQQQIINIERQTDYSTISVSLREKRDIEEASRFFTPFQDLIELFAVSFNGAIEFLIVVLGFVIPIGVLILLWKGIKRIARR